MRLQSGEEFTRAEAEVIAALSRREDVRRPRTVARLERRGFVADGRLSGRGEDVAVAVRARL